MRNEGKVCWPSVAEKWQAKACAKCLAGTHLSIKKGPNGVVTPVAPLPSSEPLPIFPGAFAAVQQRRAAFSGPP